MRSHFLQSVLGLTVLGAALVACGDDGAGTGGGGGGSADSSSAATNPDATSTGATPVTSTGTQGSPTPASSGSTGPCAAGDVFQDPDFQACNEENCCEQLTACAQDPDSCFGADGALDTSLGNGEALYSCAYHALCFGPQAFVCDSGIAFGDGETAPSADTIDFAYCLDQSCCEELTDCTAGGTDACIDCLDGDAESYELCQAASDCAEASCDQALIFAEYCDSGIGTSSGELGLCGSAACCTEWNACSGGTDADGAPLDPERAEACLACLDGDGVGICEAVDACMDESCSTEVCDSGFVVRSLDLAACLTESCCEAWNTCTTNGTDVDACDECLASEDGGPLCDAAIECYEENCAD